MQGFDLKRIKANLRRTAHHLEKRYGLPKRKGRGDPLDVLIQTILSQNTNDHNRDQAYQRLKTFFPTWEEVLRAPYSRVVQALRPGGLAHQKAKRIRKILRWIKREKGRLSLSFLRKMDSEQLRRTMGSLEGIGPKTLHCLLLFGLGREAFPVDTHILRVGKRLGFIPKEMGSEKSHPWLAPLIPKGKSLSLHLNLLRFGREICKARNPLCNICFLKRSGPCFEAMKRADGSEYERFNQKTSPY